MEELLDDKFINFEFNQKLKVNQELEHLLDTENTKYV